MLSTGPWKLIAQAALGVLLALCVSPGNTADVVGDGFRLTVAPQQPAANIPVRMRSYRDEERCIGVYENEFEIDHHQRTIDISLSVTQFREDIPCFLEIANELMLGVLENPGTYAVNYYIEERVHQAEYFQPQSFLGSDTITSQPLPVSNFAETPQAGSIQSGIGLVRGWACYAQSIEIQFNDQPRQKVAYGTARPDTLEVCGDTANGYGMVVGWGNLGAGSHRMRTFVDDVQVDEVLFDVATLDSPFERGLSGNYTIENFANDGGAVEIQWSEAAQNFVIIRHQAVSGSPQ